MWFIWNLWILVKFRPVPLSSWRGSTWENLHSAVWEARIFGSGGGGGHWGLSTNNYCKFSSVRYAYELLLLVPSSGATCFYCLRHFQIPVDLANYFFCVSGLENISFCSPKGCHFSLGGSSLRAPYIDTLDYEKCKDRWPLCRSTNISCSCALYNLVSCRFLASDAFPNLTHSCSALPFTACEFYIFVCI